MMKKMMHKKRIKRRAKQEIHGKAPEMEIIPVVKELNTAQYAWCRDNTDVLCSRNTRGQEVLQ